MNVSRIVDALRKKEAREHLDSDRAVEKLLGILSENWDELAEEVADAEAEAEELNEKRVWGEIGTSGRGFQQRAAGTVSRKSKKGKIVTSMAKQSPLVQRILKNWKAQGKISDIAGKPPKWYRPRRRKGRDSAKYHPKEIRKPYETAVDAAKALAAWIGSRRSAKWSSSKRPQRASVDPVFANLTESENFMLDRLLTEKRPMMGGYAASTKAPPHKNWQLKDKFPGGGRKTMVGTGAKGGEDAGEDDDEKYGKKGDAGEKEPKRVTKAPEKKDKRASAKQAAKALAKKAAKIKMPAKKAAEKKPISPKKVAAVKAKVTKAVDKARKAAVSGGAKKPAPTAGVGKKALKLPKVEI